MIYSSASEYWFTIGWNIALKGEKLPFDLYNIEHYAIFKDAYSDLYWGYLLALEVDKYDI